MAKKLQDYFPMIRTRKEVLNEIERQNDLLSVFEDWTEEQQEEFLDFCTGSRGIKILYDFIFKEIFSPEYHPERIERFLSLILSKNVKISQILPNDTVRIADECTLLITDIVVELEDGSLANVEIQKIGYAFPGERMACYSADLLLRQYKRVKAKRKSKFTYRDIKTVYTIVLFEKCTKEFKKAQQNYVHRGKNAFDTGLQLNTLQEYILIPLDIFKESTHNKTIENELDAWLTFISFDEPEKIIELIESYPEFKAMYEELYQFCLNIERVMGMFSKELLELDRNTVQYMIEEQEKELETLKKQSEEWKHLIQQANKKFQETEAKFQASEAKFQETEAKFHETEAKFQETEAKFQETEAKFRASEARRQEMETENQRLKKMLDELKASFPTQEGLSSYLCKF